MDTQPALLTDEQVAQGRPTTPWRIDERTKAVGRQGLRAARENLAAASARRDSALAARAGQAVAGGQAAAA